jgi:hypothetical protein
MGGPLRILKRVVETPTLPRLLTVLSPLALVCLLLAVICGGDLWDCIPYWHDEVWYWNEIAVFHAAGFHGGYTVTNEIPAPATFVHFGTHGPVYPALHGSLTRLVGLFPCSIPVLNAACLLLASTIWVLVCRAGRRVAWAGLLVVVTFWPLILYLPSSMQETLHHAIAFLVAAVVVASFQKPESRLRLLVALAIVVAAAQIRVTWCWVILPLFWVGCQPQRWSGRIAIFGAALAIIAALYAEAVWLYSPHPNFMSEFLSRATESPLAGLTQLMGHTAKNLVRYVVPDHGSWLERGLRVQVLLILGAAIYHVVRLGRQRRGTFEPSNLFPAAKRESGQTMQSSGGPGERSANGEDCSAAFTFVLLNLLGIVGFVIAFYDVMDWRDYRVVAPHLLLSLLVLLGVQAAQWLTGYVLLALLLGLLAPGKFAEFHRGRVAYDAAQIAAFSEQMGNLVRVDEQASAWDKTLLVHIDRLNSPLLLGLPRGIGVSIVYRWQDQAYPPRSKYVLLTNAEINRLGVPSSLARVAATPLGDLYVRR